MENPETSALEDQDPDGPIGDPDDDPNDPELEDDDEAEGEQGDGEPPALSVTPEEAEKRAQAAERAFSAYVKKLGTTYGDEAVELIRCPLCVTEHPAFLHVQDVGRVPDAVKQDVLTLLGFAREQDYKQLAGVGPCPGCDGKGKVATGSSVPNYTSLTCPECGGRGFYPPAAGAGNGQGDAAHLTGAPPPAVEHDALPEVDAWGDPRVLPDGRENPNFGRMPQYKVPIEPYGRTAGLTALDTPAEAA